LGAFGEVIRGNRLSSVVSGMVQRMATVIVDVLKRTHTEEIRTWARVERVKWYPGCGR
jgi:hypothetical protein